MRILAWRGHAALPVERWERAIKLGDPLGPAPEPARPEGVDLSLWRRAGGLARLACHVALPLTEAAPDVILWATGLGELDATGRFLDRLSDEGPATLSAAAFQGSLPGTAAAILSIAAAARAPERRCPVETFAGAQAGACALLRAEVLLALGRAQTALVVGAELPHPVVAAAGAPPPAGVAAAALFGRAVEGGPPAPRLAEPDPIRAFGTTGIGPLIAIIARVGSPARSADTPPG